MKTLVLQRHGESVWNKENKFTGWVDVDLSEKGVEEAKKAGQILRKEGYTFDVAFTSVLKRATRTLELTLKEMKHKKIPIHKFIYFFLVFTFHPHKFLRNNFVDIIHCF